MTTLQLIKKELEEQADEGRRKGIRLRARTAEDYNRVSAYAYQWQLVLLSSKRSYLP